MKKILLTLVIALSTSVSSFAQFDLGDFDLGAGFRTYLGSQCFGTPLYGAYIGTNFTFNELLGPVDLGLGVLVSQGVYSAIKADTKVEDDIIRTQDFQFPIYFRGRLEFDSCDLYLMLGPTFNAGVNLQNKHRDAFYGDTIIDFYKPRGTQGGSLFWQYTRFDIMASVGAGVIFGERFRIHVGFDYGCLPRCIEDYYPESGIFGVDQKSHNMQLAIGLAYTFRN